MKIITVKANDEDIQQYKKLCKDEDTTMSQDIRKYIKKRISEVKEK